MQSKIRIAFVIVLFLGVIFAGREIYLFACGGTPIPPDCSQTAWLAKMTPITVVNPGSGDITVPVTVLPYVAWNINAACASPVAAEIALTFTCTPEGGGPDTVIGPTVFTTEVPTPVFPGIQPLAGGPLLFVIPDGTLSTGTFVCDVVGTYSVSFAGGGGAGLLIGMGDTEVCIVEPSDLDASLPRLSLSLIDTSTSGLGYYGCRRGDQVCLFYLVENNDSTNTASLTFSTNTNQVSRLPGGDTNDGGSTVTFAISNVEAGTDNFPQSINCLPGELVPLPDPTAKDDLTETTTLVIGPKGLQIVKVCIRSYGMCTSGSCSEVLTKVRGTFSDNTVALACAGTALFVNDAEEKSPLCEVEDLIKAEPETDMLFSPAVFDGDPHLSTHLAGNIFQPSFFLPQGNNQITGEQLQIEFNQPFPSHSHQYIRLDNPPQSCFYQSAGFAKATNFVANINNVFIGNLPEQVQIGIPFIRANVPVPVNLQLNIDGSTQMAIVVNQNDPENPIFDGPLENLIAMPPPGYVVDPDSCRTISCSGISDLPLMAADPPLYSGVLNPNNSKTINIRVFEPLTDEDLPWSVTSTNPLFVPEKLTGSAGDFITIIVEPILQIASAPDTTKGNIIITNGSTLNKVVIVPLAFRLGENDGPIREPNASPDKIKNEIIGLDLVTVNSLLDGDWNGDGVVEISDAMRAFQNSYETALDGTKEIPVVNTLATGTGIFQFNRDYSQVQILTRAEGLEGGSVTGIHLHIGTSVENGRIVMNLTPTIKLNPGDGTFEAEGIVEVPAAERADLPMYLQNSQIYVNVHTTNNPGGEVRGTLEW